MSAFSRLVGLRYLWTKRSEAFITIISIISVLGVAIGVMVINIVMAVMTGFELELREKIIGTTSHITVRNLAGKIADWREISDKIGNISGVSAVSPYTYHQALIRVGERSAGVLIRGIDPDSASGMQVTKYLEGGAKLDLLKERVVVKTSSENFEEISTELPPLIIGRELQRTLGVFTGSPVSIFTPTVTSSPFGLIPKFRRFGVAASYKSGLVEYESSLVYAAIADIQRFFGMGDSITGFEVKVREIDNSPAISKQIIESLGGLSSGFYSQDWTESNRPLWEAIKLEKRVYFIVLLLIVVMASFSIVSTLIMLVLEKRRDIAVLKTLGATQSQIGGIFRFQGTTIGILGTGLGLALGYIGCLALQAYQFPIDERIFQMSSLPVKIQLENFIVVGLAAFGICFSATIYPSYRASKLEPTEILRFE